MNQINTTIKKAKLIEMTEHALLSVKGPDAKKFLQGQCTCDIEQAEQGSVLIGAHCNPKGRIISSFNLVKIAEDEFCLRMRKSILLSSIETLKKYSVFFKVTLEQYHSIPLAILGELETNNPIIDKIPLEGTSVNNNGTIISNNGNHFIELWVTPSQLPDLYSDLEKITNTAAPAALDYHLIEQGIVEICPQTQGEYIPQDLNFQLIGAVSFTKGCYTGQEIIARMQYRAQLKKHTYHAIIETCSPVVIGACIISPDKPDKALGTILCSSSCHPTDIQPDKFVHALIATTIETFSDSSAIVEKNSKAKISWVALPYAIP